MLALSLYRGATAALSPVLPLLLYRRERQKKDDPARRHQRLARDLAPRPDGPLIWFHGASVGETQLLYALAEALRGAGWRFTGLFTAQTQTGVEGLQARCRGQDHVQMAPIDTPSIADRFMTHWSPNLLIVAEGEIWPNLLRKARKTGIKCALVNARMTARSRRGWQRWPKSAQAVFSAFDLLIAANAETAEALRSLVGNPVTVSGNLKTALSTPPAALAEDASLAGFIANRRCLLLASTHEGEETFVLDALGQHARDLALIIAPRHPARAEALMIKLKDYNLSVSRLSSGESAGPQTHVLLADTIGEMARWYRVADLVYLGGGHARGVGGHNPMEAILFGKPVLSGPDVFNFASLFDELTHLGGVHIAPSGEDLTACILSWPVLPQTGDFTAFLNRRRAPLDKTLAALSPLGEMAGALAP